MNSEFGDFGLKHLAEPGDTLRCSANGLLAAERSLCKNLFRTNQSYFIEIRRALEHRYKLSQATECSVEEAALYLRWSLSGRLCKRAKSRAASLGFWPLYRTKRRISFLSMLTSTGCERSVKIKSLETTEINRN